MFKSPRLMHSCKSRLAAALIAFGSLSISSQAAILWQVSEVGGDLVLATTGDLNLTGHSPSGTNTFFNDAHIHNDGVLGRDGSVYFQNAIGTWSSPGNLVVDPFPYVVTGESFGTIQGTLYWDTLRGTNPGVINPSVSITYTGRTIANTFGTALDAGNLLIWTSNITGDTVSIGLAPAPVPEPSSTALLGLGGLTLILRRRR